MSTDSGNEQHSTRVTAGSEELVKFRKALAKPGWLANLSAQAQAIEWYQQIKDLLHLPEREEVLSALSQKLDIPLDRLHAICRLETHSEITRALLSPYIRGPIPRVNSDSLYPTDGFLGNYLDYVGGNESHLSWHFWVGVAILGAAARRNFYIDQGNYYVYPNHYVMLLGPSGSKKGAALAPGNEILERTNFFLANMSVHPADRIAIAPRKAVAERLLYLIQAKKITDELTGVERWADSVAFFPISELSVLLGKSVFHSDHFIHVITDLYDCPDIWPMSTFKRGDEVLRNVAISLVGCTTEDWLEEAISQTAFTGGFMGRCIVLPRSYSNKEYPVADYLDPVTRDRLTQSLVKLATAPKQMIKLEDREWYDEWYHRSKSLLRNLEDSRLQGYYSRRHTHLLRLAMVLSLSKETYVIRHPAMQAASAILEHEEQFLAQAINRLGKHYKAKIVDRVMEVINSFGGKGGISRTELSRRTHNVTGGKFTLDRVLETLRDQGKVDVRHEGKTRFYVSLHREKED